jgi:hypothetical protein
MTGRHTGRKRYAIDFWKDVSDGDPDWTSYSDDQNALISEAEELREHFAKAILYERNFNNTPPWDTVERYYWSDPRPLWG